MELKEFVKQTIIQITDGIREGNDYVRKNQFGQGIDDTMGKKIEFDVAVTSTDAQVAGAGAGISVAQVFNVGGKTEATSSNSNASRIQFTVFLHLKLNR